MLTGVRDPLEQLGALFAVPFQAVRLVRLLDLALWFPCDVARDFLVASRVVPPIRFEDKKFVQDRLNCGFFFPSPRADETLHCFHVSRQRFLFCVILADQAAVGRVLDKGKVRCRLGVVADVEWVVIDDGLLDRASSMKLALLRYPAAKRSG